MRAYLTLTPLLKRTAPEEIVFADTIVRLWAQGENSVVVFLDGTKVAYDEPPATVLSLMVEAYDESFQTMLERSPIEERGDGLG